MKNNWKYGSFIMVLLLLGHSLRAQSVNVKDYGAVGNARNDDTKAIQNAVNAAYKNKSTVFIPAGVYLVSHIDIKASLKGDNRKSVLKRINVQGLSKYRFCNASRVNDISVTDMAFDGNVVLVNKDSAVGGGVPLILSNCGNVTIKNCVFSNSPMSGLRIEGKSHDINIIGCKTNRTRGVYGDGYYIETSKNINVSGCTATDYTRIGFVVERNSSNIKFDNCIANNGHDASVLRGGIEYNAGFWYENGVNIKTINCIASNNTHYGFVASSGTVQTNAVVHFDYIGCKSSNNATGYNVSASQSPVNIVFKNCYATNVSRGFTSTARNNRDSFTFTNCHITILSKSHQGANDAGFQWESTVKNKAGKLPVFYYNKCNISYTGKVPHNMIKSASTNNADISTYNGGFAAITIDNCTNNNNTDGFVIKTIRGNMPDLNIRNTKVNTKYTKRNYRIKLLK